MEVLLSGFTSDGVRQFVLPHFEAPVLVFPKTGGREDVTATLDTIVFEPDHERFTMTWRVARPLKRDIFEISQVVVGRHSPRIPGELVNDPEAAFPAARLRRKASLV
jgi:hypothetical protein